METSNSTQPSNTGLSQSGFSQHRREIALFEIPTHPGDGATPEALDEWARAKAANFYQHVIGYGALAEGERKKANIAEPDLSAMRNYRLERIRQQQ